MGGKTRAQESVFPAFEGLFILSVEKSQTDVSSKTNMADAIKHEPLGQSAPNLEGR